MKTYPIFKKREITDLNGVWDFSFFEGKKLDDINAKCLEYKDLMCVPGAFDSMPTYAGKRGVACYRKMVEVTPGKTGRLNFGAVGMWCQVLVDGEVIGEHASAYTPFYCDLPISDREAREVVVMVCNMFDFEKCPLQEDFFDFFHYGGIFRDVTLHELPECFIEWAGVVPVDAKQGIIEAKVEMPELGFDFFGVNFAVNGCAVEAELDKAEAGLGIYRIKVADPVLWEPDSPVLYELTVSAGGDELVIRFGLRDVKAERGKILLNGKPVKLLGYCRHEAHPQFGSALPFPQLVADLQILKDLGCNFVRGSHYPQDQRFLDLCDEMGILVFEESMGWGHGEKQLTDEHFIQAQIEQTREMVRASYSHPSVILWGFLNEGESNNESNRKCYESLINLLREMDSSRLVTYACNRGIKDKFLEQLDVICYNTYPGWYAHDHEAEYPQEEIVPCVRKLMSELEDRGLKDKPFILSEIGAGAIYGWHDQLNNYWTEDYQSECLDRICREVVDNDDITGVALWQFCDCRTYRGFRALGRPRAFNNKGTLDEYRRPKKAYWTVKDIFTKYKG